MITKTFTAGTINEAEELINKEMGPNAIILTTRQIKPRGFKALLFSSKIEVTAAVEDDDLETFQIGTTPSPQQSSFMQMQDNLVNVKELINTLVVPDSSPYGSLKAEKEEVEEPSPVDVGWMEEIKIPSLAQFLISKGVSRTIALDIVTNVYRRLGISEMPVEAKLRKEMLNSIKKELANLTKASGPITLFQGQPKICAIVGPSGVGKTTTAIKIALQYMHELQKKAVVVTLNTGKIGAFEQISALAQKYHIPLAKAKNVQELQEIFKTHHEVDLIILDTPGCSPYQWQKVDELMDILSTVNGLETHLALCAATKDVDILGAIQQYSRLNIESLIFTKLDETINWGTLVNACAKAEKPVSYLTNGQRIPEDLSIASSEEIARSILVQHNTHEFDQLRQLADK